MSNRNFKEGQRPCLECDGLGYLTVRGNPVCATCKGCGYVEFLTKDLPPQIKEYKIEVITNDSRKDYNVRAFTSSQAQKQILNVLPVGKAYTLKINVRKGIKACV